MKKATVIDFRMVTIELLVMARAIIGPIKAPKPRQAYRIPIDVLPSRPTGKTCLPKMVSSNKTPPPTPQPLLTSKTAITRRLAFK